MEHLNYECPECGHFTDSLYEFKKSENNIITCCLACKDKYELETEKD